MTGFHGMTHVSCGDSNLCVTSVTDSIGPFHANVNQKICRLEIVFDRLWYPLSILLLAAIGAKLIGPHGGLQVDKKKFVM